MITYVKSIEVPQCKNPFSLSLTSPLPQLIKLQGDTFYSIDMNEPKGCHDNIVLVINNHRFIELLDLIALIKNFSLYATQRLCVVVNKFLVYTSVNNSDYLDSTSFDQRLINRISSLKNFSVESYNFQDNDNGNLGNFIYPVTNIIFKRNES